MIFIIEFCLGTEKNKRDLKKFYQKTWKYNVKSFLKTTYNKIF